jgi:hypothetical protein
VTDAQIKRMAKQLRAGADGYATLRKALQAAQVANLTPGGARGVENMARLQLELDELASRSGAPLAIRPSITRRSTQLQRLARCARRSSPPHKTKRKRQETCSWTCRNALIAVRRHGVSIQEARRRVCPEAAEAVVVANTAERQRAVA